MGTIVINEKYDKCRERLKESISKKRYLHSVGVSDTSACLAMRYGYDVRSAALAGLLHDCAKGLSDDRLLKIVENEGIGITSVERDNPDLLHAKAGIVIARQQYGIDEEEILSAIFYHTTGKPEMTLLEKIVFVADYIEPNREGIPGLENVRKEAFTDLDSAVMMCCLGSIEHLKRASREIDRATVETYEYYRRLYK